jgi:hypothetical protein
MYHKVSKTLIYSGLGKGHKEAVVQIVTDSYKASHPIEDIARFIRLIPREVKNMLSAAGKYASEG